MTREREGEGKGRGAARSSRGLALDVLLRVETRGAFAAAALEAELGRSTLESRDRAFATDLVYGTLRWRLALDRRLAERSSRPLGELDPVLAAALRLAAYQLLGPSRVPAHAAVGETVGLVRHRRGRGMAGFANGVLRALSASRAEPLDPAEALPGWLREAVGRRLGEGEAAAFARSTVEQPWTGLRVEPHRASRAELVDRIRAEAGAAELALGEVSPLAVRARGLGPLGRLGAHRDGWMSVQDEGAQAVTLLVEPEAGSRILDACAGRGGKTTLLAGLTGGRAEIDAADRHPAKLARIAGELERIGLPPVRTVAVDLEVGTGELRPPYDRILVDAPCSGTGTLARRPEIRLRLAPADLARLVEVQGRILDRCAGLLAPGGALVYAVCSVLEPEGPGQVASLLAREAGRGLVLDRVLELWPQRHGTDGFYAARLVRTGLDPS